MPRYRRYFGFVATCIAFALSVAAVGRSDAADPVPGVTDTEVVLGGTHPFSGPASAYGVIAKGIDAYFAYVNDHGGVNGRKITYKDLDDGYSPPQALQLTKQLVEQDHVFAIFNSLGTAVNIALRPYLNDQKVPQLFVATGATTWGTDYQKFPWTMGFNADYTAEAVIFGKYIVAHQKDPKVGILYQNDDLGQDYLTGTQRGLGSIQVTKTQSYEVSDPDVRSQMAALKSSGADTVVIAATPKFATQALVAIGQLGWKPTIYLTDVSASAPVMRAAAQGSPGVVKDVITATYYMDPTNPLYANVKGMKMYKDIIAKYGAGADPTNAFVLYGMSAAYTMVDTLQRAGKDLTRAKIMDAAMHINERDNPFLLPGIVVETSPTDRFPIRQEQLFRYTGTDWQPFGPVIDARK